MMDLPGVDKMKDKFSAGIKINARRLLHRIVYCALILAFAVYAAAFSSCGSGHRGFDASGETAQSSVSGGGIAQDAVASASADFPRVGALDRARGVSHESDAGNFTLFIVDKFNTPNLELAQKFTLDFTAETDSLIVTADIIEPTDHFYIVLYYDNTELSPTGIDFSDFFGGEDEVLTLAMMNRPGHLEAAIQQIPSSGVRPRAGSGEVMTVRFARSAFLSARSTSSVEEVRRNMAPIDFAPTDNPDGSFILGWTERNVGDYDGSGEVGVADITPIAQNYLKNVADATTPLELELYEQIDGDRSGEIGISDITPIASNYLNRIEGYDIWRAGDTWEEKDWLPNEDNPELPNAEAASAARPARSR